MILSASATYPVIGERACPTIDSPVLSIRMPVDRQTTESIAIDATAVTMEVTLFKEPIQWTAN